MNTTFATDDQYTTPPSTPRRLVTDEAYYPPRSHLVGLGLDFAFPAQSTVIGLEQCSASRLGCFASSADSPCQGSRDYQGRCASYWSSDSSLSSRSMATTPDSGDGNAFPSPFASSEFAYSPFASNFSPTPRESDGLSSQVFRLGLALNQEEEESHTRYQTLHQRSLYASQHLGSSSFEDGEESGHEYLSRIACHAPCSPMFGFAPAPSYSHAVKHTKFALLPSVTIEKDVSSSSLTASSPAKDECEELFGTDPFFAEGMRDLSPNKGLRAIEVAEKKRKRKESTIAGSQKSRKPYQESENVKRLKTSPALRHLNIFTHAAMMEDRGRIDEEASTMHAFSGLRVDTSRCEMDSPFTPPPPPSMTFEDSPESASSCCSLSTVPTTTSPSRMVDCTLLISNMPSESPYPPTPSSSAFAPFLYTSTIESVESPSSSTFKEEIKKEICSKLALGTLGMGIKDVNVFTTAPPTSSRTGSQSRPRTPIGSAWEGNTRSSSCEPTVDRRGMVVVVHTA